MKTKLSIFCGKIIEAGWLAAAVAVPLFFNIYTARTFEPDKITLLRSIAGVMILFWLVQVIEQGISNAEGNSISLADNFRGWLKTPLFLPTLFLALIYIISTIFSISPQVSLWGSYQRLQGTYSALSYIVIFALMVGNLRTREQVDRLVTTIIVTSIPISLYGVIQKYGLDPLPWAGDVTTRVASTMGNAIFVASYLIMVMPLTLARLIESMTSIIKEKEASWGYTILAAIYIFALAVQGLTVVFSQSRGPMLGILAAVFVMGLLLFLLLRNRHRDSSRLSLSEIGQGLVFAVPLAITGGLGGAVMAAFNKGWRWLWLSWLGIAALAIAFIITLNLTIPGLDPYLNPVRNTPYVNRLANIAQTQGGSGKVRILIWDAAMDLIAPHEPLGIVEDDFASEDKFNVLRPLVGYGPESMFNAFAYVYPPDLAHVEARGSSADRSHNETMDSLVITGILGFIAFYLIISSLFYYIVNWLGWAPDNAAKQRLIALLLASGLIGASIPYFLVGSLTFMPVGLPFGLVVGMVLHLTWQGIFQQKFFSGTEQGNALSQVGKEIEAISDQSERKIASPSLRHNLLLIGILGTFVGHFIEVHFVFSIAATYTYFWIYVGLLVALGKIRNLELAAQQEATPSPEVIPAEQIPEPVVTSRRKKRRGRRANAKKKMMAGVNTSTRYSPRTKRESWETWLGGQGLAMSIILIILTFDFVTPQFDLFDEAGKGKALFWMMSITWLIGFAMVLSNLAVRQSDWPGRINWGRAVMLYALTSFSYFIFYLLAHRYQFGQRVTVQTIDDVVKAADVLTNGLFIFYIFLLLLMGIIGLTLSWKQTRGLMTWRADITNLLLYPILIIATLGIIWFKNMDVVRADTYLKEGERYRGQKQWNQAIALHEKGRSIDSDEDFYYLMLALDYQLMAQDTNLEPGLREQAWRQGEQIALDARNINPYNPDNTGNMGRYYFTLGQISNPDHYQNALSFFEKATVLAPSNVIYHNLWAQTHYILQNYEAAVDRLQTSVSIDPGYFPTWILLGDTYAAMGNVDKSLMAHSEAMKIGGFNNFADQFLDQRLNFYISAGRSEDLISILQNLNMTNNTRVLQIIARIYNLQGQRENAIPYLEEARALGDTSAGTLRELSNIYLALNNFEQAAPLYQLLLEQNSNDVESHSALAFIQAQQGNLPQAIEHNLAVVGQLSEDYDSWKNLALLYRDNGQLPEAIDAAQHAQAVAPEAEAPSWTPLIADLENRLAANN